MKNNGLVVALLIVLLMGDKFYFPRGIYFDWIWVVIFWILYFVGVIAFWLSIGNVFLWIKDRKTNKWDNWKTYCLIVAIVFAFLTSS